MEKRIYQKMDYLFKQEVLQEIKIELIKMSSNIYKTEQVHAYIKNKLNLEISRPTFYNVFKTVLQFKKYVNLKNWINNFAQYQNEVLAKVYFGVDTLPWNAKESFSTFKTRTKNFVGKFDLELYKYKLKNEHNIEVEDGLMFLRANEQIIAMQKYDDIVKEEEDLLDWEVSKEAKEKIREENNEDILDDFMEEEDE